MPSQSFLLERYTSTHRATFVLDLNQSQGYEVHALDMTVGEKMKSLGCHTHQCDLTSEGSIQAFAKSFKGKQMDLLLNIAGMLHLRISRIIPVPGVHP